MARQKRESAALNLGEKRAAGLRSIDPKLDLGGGVTLKAVDAAIAGLRGKLETYNSLLSQADQQLNGIVADEKALRDLLARALTGVSTKYGRDSSEYEKAGGIRQSERKRPAKKKPEPK